jgi:hypothetical protein
MRKALTVAALLFAIGLLLGYIGLSVRNIQAEAQTAPFQNPDIYIGGPYSDPFIQPTPPPYPFQFGPPPVTALPSTPMPKLKSKAEPKFVPPPPESCVADTDPCRLRQVNVI